MLRTLSFGSPGDGGLGGRLLAAVLRGEKTATSSPAVAYLTGEPMPRRAFWAEVADLVRADASDPGWALRASEPVVVHWFRLLDDDGPHEIHAAGD